MRINTNMRTLALIITTMLCAHGVALAGGGGSDTGSATSEGCGSRPEPDPKEPECRSPAICASTGAGGAR